MQKAGFLTTRLNLYSGIKAGHVDNAKSINKALPEKNCDCGLRPRWTQPLPLAELHVETSNSIDRITAETETLLFEHRTAGTHVELCHTVKTKTVKVKLKAVASLALLYNNSFLEQKRTF